MCAEYYIFQIVKNTNCMFTNELKKKLRNEIYETDYSKLLKLKTLCSWNKIKKPILKKLRIFAKGLVNFAWCKTLFSKWSDPEWVCERGNVQVYQEKSSCRVVFISRKFDEFIKNISLINSRNEKQHDST